MPFNKELDPDPNSERGSCYITTVACAACAETVPDIVHTLLQLFRAQDNGYNPHNWKQQNFLKSPTFSKNWSELSFAVQTGVHWKHHSRFPQKIFKQTFYAENLSLNLL